MQSLLASSSRTVTGSPRSIRQWNPACSSSTSRWHSSSSLQPHCRLHHGPKLLTKPITPTQQHGVRCSRSYATSTTPRPLKLAIIGSGPSAFYAASRILHLAPIDSPFGSKVEIHMYERLPTPYGLVRYGVAPDHPEVKVSGTASTCVGVVVSSRSR